MICGKNLKTPSFIFKSIFIDSSYFCYIIDNPAMSNRELEIVVLSDVHLGNQSCQADALLKYLKGIDPTVLILNGDFVDAWQFKNSYFPQAHAEVINEILKKAITGTKIYYLAGNHDGFIRKFVPFRTGNIQFKDELLFQLNGKKYWFFHGDQKQLKTKKSGHNPIKAFQKMIRRVGHSKWLGNKKRIHLSNAQYPLKYINDFEKSVVGQASVMEVDYVICGHVHEPALRKYTQETGNIVYMNAGDWVRHLSALEYDGQRWTIHRQERIRNHSSVNMDATRSKVIYLGSEVSRIAVNS